MTNLWRNKKLIAALLSSFGGGTLLGMKYINNNDSETEKGTIEGSSQRKPKGSLQLPSVLASWTTDFTPSVAWDHNWDRRAPKSLVKPLRNSNDSINNNDLNEKLEAVTSKAVRHIILIRHGQYYEEEGTDEKRILTPLGREQADLVGKRLQELNLPYTSIVSSTMSRAIETADLISKYLPDVQRLSNDLLREGAPIPPEPPVGHWRPNVHQFYEDGARIEAAFRHFFHRAPSSQEKDSYDVLVCHANVIRYFVCRALQFPPEAWLRLSLHHASITWLIIQPNGRVGMVAMGDFGFMPSKKLSKR